MTTPKPISKISSSQVPTRLQSPPRSNESFGCGCAVKAREVYCPDVYARQDFASVYLGVSSKRNGGSRARQDRPDDERCQHEPDARESSPRRQACIGNRIGRRRHGVAILPASNVESAHAR